MLSSAIQAIVLWQLWARHSVIYQCGNY